MSEPQRRIFPATGDLKSRGTSAGLRNTQLISHSSGQVALFGPKDIFSHLQQEKDLLCISKQHPVSKMSQPHPDWKLLPSFWVTI